MRLSIKAKQVAGVTSIVGLVVVGLSLIHLASLARVSLEESRSRGELLLNAIYQRARGVVAASDDPYAALRGDPGVRSLLESSSAYSRNVIYAAIVDPKGQAIAHSFSSLEGRQVPPQADLRALLERSALAQVRAIYADRTLEMRQSLIRDDEHFGSIAIGMSSLLIRDDLRDALYSAGASALVALLVATGVAMLLAQWLLGPIHVIKSGLTRLGAGEFDVKLDLPLGDEFGELGSSFNAISEQLSAVRAQAAGKGASLETVVDRLEDAVAVFNPQAGLMFANSAMRAALPDLGIGRSIREALPAEHPYRRMVEQTLVAGRSQGPLAARPDADRSEGAGAELVITTHAIQDLDHRLVGVMLIARNLDYLSHVQSTLNYSRKLASLSRLFAGVAHEVKNPLNAMTIHLELVKQKLLQRPRQAAAPQSREPAVVEARAAAVGATGETAGFEEPAVELHAAVVADGGSTRPGQRAAREPARHGLGLGSAGGHDSGSIDVPAVMKHVTIISDEIRRLDQVVQGFLKFTRPEELSLQPVVPLTLIQDIVRVVEPEAEANGITIVVECEADLPDLSADPTMLRQALLNLAMNACQAMPDGGTLRIGCRAVSGRRLAIEIEDNGTGIPADHLEKIFDLYFTTKTRGSGIGLSMVYRIVQLHDGEVEVQSTPGRGTTFRLLLPQA